MIVTLRLREASLVVHATGDGPRFKVVAKDGSVLSDNLSSDGLALRHQKLYRIYTQGYARGEEYIDARLDLPVARDPDAPPPGHVGRSDQLERSW